MISLTEQEISSLTRRGIIGFVKPKGLSKKALYMRRYRKQDRAHYLELNRRHARDWRAQTRKSVHAHEVKIYRALERWPSFARAYGQRYVRESKE